MIRKFEWLPFSECALADPFFESLKEDYEEFPEWFLKKVQNNEKAFVYKDEWGICAFIYFKDEEEEIRINDKVLPQKKRIKIGTFKLDDRVQGQRLGEGALGVALWKWQESDAEEIYLTIFPKHKVLIELIEKFGFKNVGMNHRGEFVYIKNKKNFETINPYTAFPYLNANFTKAGYIPIYDYYHDTLFPFSELYNTKQDFEEIAAANGITKVYIGFPYGELHHREGEPVIIYRIHTGENRQYKSVATSYCTLTKIKYIKKYGRKLTDLNDFILITKNKTVFTNDQLEEFYDTQENIVVIEMIYNGFFGKGKNITFKKLKDMGLFEGHPYNIRLSREQFLKILELGGKNVQNTIID
ncbi:GNAT family protein [Carboxydothermus pertinax]|uniref:N-acetyltransferase domain-containing protein n=1 Tax=Carboxydothermus pertinax TaxID=870242 RepID=A0A1L8CWP8_9THEO|nr:GNAT family protein [Carboxydothermus pertinax]GAV23289.1 hypothetical protein cpu_17990 [Carboxydothermus pertinax]